MNAMLLKLCLYFDLLECFDYVAFLDVIAVLQAYAALVVGCHLAHVVLEPLEGCDVCGLYHYTVAYEACLVGARHFSVGNECSGHEAYLADVEYLAHFYCGGHFFLDNRFEHSLHCGFYFAYRVVYN